jgi:hypothetical protein
MKISLALGTCNCNVIYRQTTKRDIKVERVELEETGGFAAGGIYRRSCRGSEYAQSGDACHTWGIEIETI